MVIGNVLVHHRSCRYSETSILTYNLLWTKKTRILEKFFNRNVRIHLNLMWFGSRKYKVRQKILLNAIFSIITPYLPTNN